MERTAGGQPVAASGTILPLVIPLPEKRLAEGERPDVFWISVDPELPAAGWNKQIGSYTSAAWAMAHMYPEFREKYERGDVDYLPFVPNPDSDVRMVSMYAGGVSVQYRVEYNAELARRHINPLLPSRLSCVFAFGTKKDAVKAAQLAGRPKWEVNAFQLVDDPLNRVHRANMHVISLMRLGERVGSMDQDTQHQVWTHYWSGGGDFALELPTGPEFARTTHDYGLVWEYLIEGRLDILERRH